MMAARALAARIAAALAGTDAASAFTAVSQGVDSLRFRDARQALRAFTATQAAHPHTPPQEGLG